MQAPTPNAGPKLNNGAEHGSSLALRRVAIDTYRENVAYLHRDCEVYRAEGFQALSKLQLRVGDRHLLATLNVTSDTTQRGATAMSFTQLFGIGANQSANQSSSFGVVSAVANAPQRIGLATPGITASTVAGDTVVLGGDNSGAIALQNVITSTRSFSAAGGIAAQTASLSDYASTFYQNVSTQSNNVTQNQTTQDDRLAEAQTRQSSDSGVNLDEELTALTTYQQAYSAGARILSVVDQLYTTLLQIQ